MSVVTTLQVEGLTCQNCVKHVTEELVAIDGVRDVSVDLVAGGVSTVTLTSDQEVPAERLAEAVDEAGYQLAGTAG